MSSPVRSIVPVVFYADVRRTPEADFVNAESAPVNPPQTGVKDFRAKPPAEAVTALNLPVFSDGADDPKASSAMDSASPSPAENPSFLQGDGDSGASVVKESQTQDDPQSPSGPVIPVMTGSVVPPA